MERLVWGQTREEEQGRKVAEISHTLPGRRALHARNCENVGSNCQPAITRTPQQVPQPLLGFS